MRRREVTAGAGILALAFAGCVSNARRAVVSRLPGRTRRGQGPAELHRRERLDEAPGGLAFQCERYATLEVEMHVREALELGYGTVPLRFTRPGAADRDPWYDDLDVEPGVVVGYPLVYDRDGEVIRRPEQPFDRVVATAPRTVSVELDHDGDTHACTYPVWVHYHYREQAYAL